MNGQPTSATSPPPSSSTEASSPTQDLQNPPYLTLTHPSAIAPAAPNQQLSHSYTPEIPNLTFGTLQARLIDILIRKVSAGEISERHLARRARLTQPHVHNALKRARGLSAPAADRLMCCMQIQLADLLRPPPKLSDFRPHGSCSAANRDRP